MTRTFARAIGLAGLTLSLAAGWARADLTFTLEEVGPDVVLSGSGSIDTSVLTPTGQWIYDPKAIISPNEGRFTLGVGFDPGNRYDLFHGAVVFGPGVAEGASSFSGDAIDLDGGDASIGLPPGYVSGSTIETTITIASRTLASLGATPGTYTWTIGDRNAITDTITLRVGAGAAVPEPSALALLAVGGLGMAIRRWRTSRSTVRGRSKSCRVRGR